MTLPGGAELELDVVVIGAGTAGLAAAKAAHEQGVRVAVVDHGPLGTLCARLGCMPSKVVLQSAFALVRAQRLGELGITLAGSPSFDWPAVRRRKTELVATFVDQTVQATKTSKAFTLLEGKARFVDGPALRVEGRPIAAARWVVATGSRPVWPALPGLDEIRPLAFTSDDLFDLETLPSSVAVIGTGPIGVELGQFLARAGSRVHLLGQDDRIAGLHPGPLQNALVACLTRELTLHMSAHIVRARGEGHGVALELAHGGEIRVDRVLLAAGRRPDIDGLGLPGVGVRIENGAPAHDEYLRTTHPAIFVAGDAAGAPAVLHAATIQGRCAGRNAAGRGDLERPKLDPALHVVFSDPEVASVGLDPDATQGDGVCVVSRPWSEQGRARIMNETAGVARIAVDRRTRKLLGCQLVGPQADLLIHLASYAMHFGATVEDLFALHHYHPTLAEMFPSLAQRAVAELDARDCIRGEVAAAIDLQ